VRLREDGNGLIKYGVKYILHLEVVPVRDNASRHEGGERND